MNSSYFSTREYVFAAMIACAQLVVASIIIPLTLPLRIPGLANTANAPFLSFLLVLGLMRLRKPGSLLLIGSIHALIDLAISPIIFFFVLSSAIFAEAVCTVLFRGYRSAQAQVAGAMLHQVAMFPAAMLFSFFLTPERFVKPVAWVWCVAIAVIALASLAGSLGGLKVGKELGRAGKLQVEVDERPC